MTDPISRITFEWRVTFGNVLTIVGGICVAVTMVVTVVSYAADLKNEVQAVALRLNFLECGLANVGILPTTVPCTPAVRRALSER